MTSLDSKPSWATIAARTPIPQPVVEVPIVEIPTVEISVVPASWCEGAPSIPTGSVLTVHLKSTKGWIVGEITESFPRTLIPSQLWTMFPHLRKHLFAHHDVDYDFLEPGGMYCFFARPGITRKTYYFEGSKYIIDFTALGVGDAEYCPACKGPIIKKYHRGFSK